jgi:hypothetical protein
MSMVPGPGAERYVRQPIGYRACLPALLPPDPPLQIDDPLFAVHSAADQAVGRLDGLAQMLPNPDLFVAMYVRRDVGPELAVAQPTESEGAG